MNFLESFLPKGYIRFFILVLATIGFAYFAPKEFASLWYVVLLVLYFRSQDEPFWLAFFFITVDGFMGFFGIYTVVLQAIPGMPSIELAQLYILLSFIKAVQKKRQPYVFYKKYLTLLLFYLVFMIVWGQLMGFSGGMNDYFRITKMVLPLLLFYSIPRLFRDIKDYERLFGFIFPIIVLAVFSQFFSLITGVSPAGAIRLSGEEAIEAGVYRGFYNPFMSLLGLFGALFLIAYKQKKVFSRLYLYIVIASTFGLAYLSATRSWIISFSIVIVFSFLFAFKISVRRLFGISVVMILFIILGFSNPIIQKQSQFSIQRLTAVEALAAGDITAGGTLKRLDIRGPRVMKKWAESPVFGWGFSDESRKYGDGHVGNQNILMFAGIVGFALLVGSMFFFCYRLFSRYLRLPKSSEHKNVLLVFIVYFLGWFVLHSSGSQHFGYSGLPLNIIPQAVFFSLGALVYVKSKESQNVKKN